MKKYIFIIFLSFIAVSPLSAKGKKVLIFVDVTLDIHDQSIRHSLETAVANYLDNLKVRGYRRVHVTVFPVNAYTLTSAPFISAEFSGRSDAINRSKRMRAIQSIKDSLSKSLNRIKKGSNEQNSSDLLSIIRRASEAFKEDKMEKELVIFSDFFQYSSELKLLTALQQTEPKDLANRVSSSNGWKDGLRNVQTSLFIPFRLVLPVKSVLRLQKFWIELFEKGGAKVHFKTHLAKS